jgi:uncharacterized protein YbjT (DUF2867 family)
VKLTVFGATGPTGRRLLERTIAAGHEVRAFYRSPEKARARHVRLEWSRGDVMDAESVEEAVEGSEAVISVLGGEPSNPLHPTRPGDPDGPGSNGARHIVQAMEKHNIKRLICQSAWGVGDSQQNADLAGSFFLNVLVPPLLRDDYADKEREEEILRNSDLDWVIVRPMILTNGYWTGNYRVRENLSPGRRPYISRADVADFLMRQLTGDDFVHRTPAIGY